MVGPETAAAPSIDEAVQPPAKPAKSLQTGLSLRAKCRAWFQAQLGFGIVGTTAYYCCEIRKTRRINPFVIIRLLNDRCSVYLLRSLRSCGRQSPLHKRPF